MLARRQLLLVLDNCEHVIGAAAQLRAGLLAAADDDLGHRSRRAATSRGATGDAADQRISLRAGNLLNPATT